MGFATSFFSGFTLTSTALYFSILHHQRTRARQAAGLHAASIRIDSITNEQLATDLAAAAEESYSGGFREGIKDYRLERRSRPERFRDGWNRELENGVRWMYNVNLGRVRDGIEERVREWRQGDRRI